MNYQDVQAELRRNADPEKAAFFPRFFKSGPGEYGYGDKFLGVTVPMVRQSIKPFHKLPLGEVAKLLHSQWHEERLAALLIMVWQYTHGDERHKQSVFEMYMDNTRYINNWDLVDSSAPKIVGPYLYHRDEQMPVLVTLAKSEELWERRIAMLATLYDIVHGEGDVALEIVEILRTDEHDLIHKATGWMLREIGKRVDRNVLLNYLDIHAQDMPRTMLRYAIEHLPTEQKQHYMKLKSE